MPHTTNPKAVVFDNRDIARYMDGDRRMAMRGFEPDYPDIVDYIIASRTESGKKKKSATSTTPTSTIGIIHGSGGTRHGREGVVQASLQSMAAFPDCRVYGNDVIWSGNEDDGFHTSHLITEVGTNTGWSGYGPPTGRKVASRCIAHCLSRDNKIFEEWILLDEPYTIRQLGFDVNAVAEQEARAMLSSVRGLCLPVIPIEWWAVRAAAASGPRWRLRRRGFHSQHLPRDLEPAHAQPGGQALQPFAHWFHHWQP